MPKIVYRTCPCCKKKISLIDYEFRAHKQNDKKILNCKFCDNEIIVGRNNKKWHFISAIFFILFGIVIFIGNPKDVYDYIIIIVLFGVPSIILDFMGASLECGSKL